jgi:hypothetical protein
MVKKIFKFKVGFSKKNFKKNFGFAQIPILIGLAIMIMVLPLGVRLVQERQDVRKGATGSQERAPDCNPGDSGRTYGECCGCELSREVRECIGPNGEKYWLTSDCVHRNTTCRTGCPEDTDPGEPTPAPNCSNQKGQRLNSCIKVESDGENWMKIEEWCSAKAISILKQGLAPALVLISLILVVRPQNQKLLLRVPVLVSRLVKI